jgi:hypothetical protein
MASRKPRLVAEGSRWVDLNHAAIENAKTLNGKS